MIIKNAELQVEKREEMRGGQGHALLKTVSKEHMPEKWRLSAIIEIAPQSSIGAHVHEGECEMFFFLDDAIVLDDGVEKTVSAGDFMFTPNRHSHSVINKSDATMRMVAVIIAD